MMADDSELELSIAIKKGNLKKVKELLGEKPGAKLKAKVSYEEIKGHRYQARPLDLAIWAKQHAIITWLVEQGADLNDPKGFSLDRIFSFDKPPDLAMAKFLIGLGANPNLRMEGGASMLDVAVSTNRLPLARFMLENGAQITDKTVATSPRMEELLAKPPKPNTAKAAPTKPAKAPAKATKTAAKKKKVDLSGFDKHRGHYIRVTGSSSRFLVPKKSQQHVIDDAVGDMAFEDMVDEGWRVVAVDAVVEDGEVEQIDALLAVHTETGKLLVCAEGTNKELRATVDTCKITLDDD